jgi:hypothetical protein
VYDTGHDPDECNGTAGPAANKGSVATYVVITDASGKELQLSVNAVGNFHSNAKVSWPISAKVVRGSATRVMQGTRMSGDCNSCHTASGANGAPGRIVVP